MIRYSGDVLWTILLCAYLRIPVFLHGIYMGGGGRRERERRLIMVLS